MIFITSLMELAELTSIASHKKALLNSALKTAQVYASWATSGGEGMARMNTVNEIKTILNTLN